MTINYHDGSTLKCSTIEVYGNQFIADGYREVDIDDVESITDDDEEEED